MRIKLLKRHSQVFLKGASEKYLAFKQILTQQKCFISVADGECSPDENNPSINLSSSRFNKP